MHSPFTTVVESGTSAMTTTTSSLYPPLPLAMTTAGAAVTQSLARALTVVTTALAGVHMTTRSTSWGVAATTNAAATSHTVPSTSTAQKYKDLIAEKAKVPSFDADEIRFVNVIEWSVELLANLQDADEVSTGSSEVVARLKELWQAYDSEGVNSMFDHIRNAGKFANERNKWDEMLKMNWRRLRTVQLKYKEKTYNFDKELKNTVDRVKVYLMHCEGKADEEQKSTSANILGSDMGSVTGHLQSKHQESVEDADPWAEYSLTNEETVKIDADGTPRIDPDPGKNFRKLAKKGPSRARGHFQGEMSRLSKPVIAFKNAKDNINFNLDQYGEFAEVKQLQKFLSSLTLAYFTICSLRASAISLFPKKDQEEDDYLCMYSQCFSRVKKKIFTVFPKFKTREDPGKTEVCIHKECIFQLGLMTSKELRMHLHVEHGLYKDAGSSESGEDPIFSDGEAPATAATTGAARQRRPPVAKIEAAHSRNAQVNPRQEVNRGSPRRRVHRSASRESSDSPQSSVSRISKSSRGSRRSRRSTTHDFLERLTLNQQKDAFKISSFVGKWGSNKTSKHQQFYDFRVWSTQLKNAEKKMDELRMSDEEKYIQLITVLENDAKTLATTTYSRSSCFRTTVKALEKEFYNQTRYVSELWRNLQEIPKMSDSDVTKMDQFYRGVQKIVNELEMLFEDSPVLIQRISTIVGAQLNRDAKKLWLNRTKANKTACPLGHSLTTKDFLECIDEVRQSAKHEQDMFYLSKPPGKDSQAGKDNGKKTEEAKQKKEKEYKTFDDAFQSFVSLASESATEGQPVSEKGEDFCALCGYKKTTKQHNFILGCKKLKKMQFQEVKSFFDNNNCKCILCFNKHHSVQDCNLPKRGCSNKIVKAFKDRKGKDRKVGEICGGSHNIYMCRQRQHMTETAEK